MTCSDAQKMDIRVLLFGFTVPERVLERICLEDRYMPVQTNKLAWSLVLGLECNGVVVDLVSFQPVGVYPNNPRAFFGYDTWDRGNGSYNTLVPFINLILFRHVTRFIGCLIVGGMVLYKTRKEQNRIILVHGVESALMGAALMFRIVSGVKVVTLVSDPPVMQIQGEGSFVRFLRSINKAVVVIFLKSMDGLITLTKHMSSHFAPKVPSIVVEGILNRADMKEDALRAVPAGGRSETEFIVLYAGWLEAGYGVELLLQAFSRINDPSFRLWILGKGAYYEKVAEVSKTDDRIVFKGYCSPDEVGGFLRSATVLINPRPANQDFTAFSFPSKTIEYMASGRPVISTRLPGIPDDYFPFLIVLDVETPEALADMLMKLRTMDPAELDEIGGKSKKFILENKNEKCQGGRIKSFFRQLMTS